MTSPGLPLRLTPPVLVFRQRAARVVERNVLVYRRAWWFMVTGLLEPVFYLLSVRIGLGRLVGTLTGPHGHAVSYLAFVAPALLATSAMNGAIFDSTFGVFFKLRYAKTYDAMLATPLDVGDLAAGEVGWSLTRSTLYGASFLGVLLVMGLVHTWWALFALPAALLIGYAFAAVGMAATTFMTSWQDFDFINLSLMPLFLFSATFFPLATYPRWLQIVVECTPLFHGNALLRGLLGSGAGAGAGLLGHVAYLAAMGAAGSIASRRRLARLLRS